MVLKVDLIIKDGLGIVNHVTIDIVTYCDLDQINQWRGRRQSVSNFFSRQCASTCTQSICGDNNNNDNFYSAVGPLTWRKAITRALTSATRGIVKI
jgi:hypothetical protein